MLSGSIYFAADAFLENQYFPLGRPDLALASYDGQLEPEAISARTIGTY